MKENLSKVVDTLTEDAEGIIVDSDGIHRIQ
jgi:hypothetical protein